VTVGQRNPSCAGLHFHPLTNLTGPSRKIVCQHRSRPGQGRGGGQPRPLTALHFSGGRSARTPSEQRPKDSLPCLRERRKAEAAMGIEPHRCGSCGPQERRAAGRAATADAAEQRKTMTVLRRRSRQPGQPGQLDAGPLEPLIGSFALHLAAEGKAARTVQGYTSAVRWFAAGYLAGQPGKTSWEQVDAPDIQRWMTQLLGRYSGAYASIQFRALRQFFKWRAAEEDLPDPMARLRAPKVTVTAVPAFTSVELSELEKACQGRSFAARRDAAIIAVFTATGIRLSELAGIRYHPDDPARGDLDLHGREIRIRGKGGTARTVKIGHQTARSLDRYIRTRARHAQAWRPQLWLGVNNRGPLTATGIYQIVARRGRQCGVSVYPRFRHHFSHTWLDRG
jgi:site-specific recombinase XerD